MERPNTESSEEFEHLQMNKMRKMPMHQSLDPTIVALCKTTPSRLTTASSRS